MELFSDSTGLYLFSALLQANAAIIAIVGVFGIFRIQNLQSKIEYIKSGLLEPRGRGDRGGINSLKVQELEDMKLNEKEENYNTYNDYCKPLLRSWIHAEKTINILKPIITKSTIWLGVGIIINTLCLMLSYLIHKVLFVEFTVFLIIFIYQIILVTILISNIKELLNFKLKDGKSINNQKK
jgi:hypothetical protein